MKYTVYQIRYTEDEIAGINAGTKSMKREIRDGMAMDFRGEKMVDLVEKALRDEWNLCIKDGSRKIVVSKEQVLDVELPSGWQLESTSDV